MSNYILRIHDKKGNSFRMKIMTTSEFFPIRKIQEAKEILVRGGWFGGAVNGEWKILDEGYIRLRSGKLRTRFSENGDLTTCDLLVLGTDGIKTYDAQDKFGMQLFQYEDVLGVNHEGEGVVIQPWVMALVPGRISWKVVEY